MAIRTIGAKFELSGEKEYKAALSEINSGLKVLSSEMGLVTAQYADNDKSVAALTAKNDVLTRTIYSQEEKVATLRNALQEAAEAYGEGDSRTQKWQISLNKAEAELLKMNGQLSENEQALDEQKQAAEGSDAAIESMADQAKKSGGALESMNDKVGGSSGQMKGFGDVLGDVANKLGINLPSGAQNAMNGLGSLDPKVALAAGGFAALAAAIVKAEKALIDMTLQSAKAADDILTLSKTTGISADALQEFEYASELLDVSMDTLQGSMTRLTRSMQDAAQGGAGDATEAFRRLGIDVASADGSLRSANDVFYEAIDRLGEIENVTERDALAMNIFGKSAQDLNPLIMAGSQSLATYAEEAKSVGYVMDHDMLQALGAVDDAQQRLKKSQEATANQISAEFAPYMEKALGDTAEFIKKIGTAFRDSGIVGSMGSLLTSVSGLLEPLGSLISAVLPALNLALKPIVQAVALLADAADVIAGILTLDFNRVGTALGFGVSSGQLSHQQQFAYGSALKYNTYDESTGKWTGGSTGGTLYQMAGSDEWLYEHNASGNYNFPGGRTVVGENGPEVVDLPPGSRIYTNQESRQMGGDTYYITIDAKSVKEFNDIVRIAQSVKFRGRME